MPNDEAAAKLAGLIKLSRSDHFEHGSDRFGSVVKIFRHTGVFFAEVIVKVFEIRQKNINETIEHMKRIRQLIGV